MIRGETIGLRARHETDVAILHSELYNDVETRSKADSRPWRPIPPGSSTAPHKVTDPSDDTASFSVVRLADDELVGEALLWSIDPHNREAHLGLSLRPAFRGQGLSVDIAAALCQYGFAIRGLHRLQVDTLATNEPMIRASTKSGFVLEGTRRLAAWVNGEFVDEVFLGLLASEWRGKSAATP
ncbi:MAG: family acetyltransferase [Amycolatopsis sp.]|jgi:RimJ/RimL family protein N-acetyltransferase|uniref:GNAT family N-acetyltransferase n=1 Tax=Amycolatopsis sp. TaxID=37632 RepID=UPI00263105FD|nr:GNAT family protein [Amycolatopsis sp.]MCU1685878.1 family acetyltransferase [Amycolatopsis sp.]